MSITTFESWREVASLQKIQDFAVQVQECISTSNPQDRQRALLRLLWELRVPIKTEDVLGDLAEMFWNAIPRFVEHALIETALKTSDTLHLNPDSFVCQLFGDKQHIDMGSDRVLRFNDLLSDGETKCIIHGLDDGKGLGIHHSSAILGAGRYELHRKESNVGERVRELVLERATDLDSLELPAQWILKPMNNTYVFLKKTDYSNVHLRRKRSSLYTSGNSVHIDAFQILSLRVPVVSWTTTIVNAALIHACQKNSGKIFFLDIGMSFGRNCIEFLKTLATCQRDAEVTVYGIDPDSASLETASLEIDKFAKMHSGMKVNVTTIPHFLENLRPEELESIFESARASEVRLVHSAFTVHHLSKENRQLALKNVVERCKPTAFVLSEPNVNHLEENYLNRVTNALGMFSLLHELIHKDPNLSVDERFAVWNTFFGKEILDIVGTHEDARSEKHEPIENWIERGLVAGLKLSEDTLARDFFSEGIFDHPICRVKFSPGLTEIQVHGTTIVGVMVFVADK
jgi:hypothetical protein